MARIKTVEQYQEEIKDHHDRLYGFRGNVELILRDKIEQELHNRVKAWALKVDVVVESPGNEQNPWTMEELGRPVKPMGLMKKTGDRQFGDYKVLVCVDKKRKKWVYLPVVVERKGGPHSKKAVLMFNWSEVALDEYSSLINFLHEQHWCNWVQYDHVHVLNKGTSFQVSDGDHVIRLDLDDKKKNVLMTIYNNDLDAVSEFKYKVKKTPNTDVLKVYDTEYGPGKGGANDLYGSVYGSTKLKSGKTRYNRDRLKDEAGRFKEDPQFKQFWIIAECTRAQFMSYHPQFRGKEKSSGFGANANSRKATIGSVGLHFGGPVSWSGTRQAAIDDFKEVINQGLVFFYAELLGLV